MIETTLETVEISCPETVTPETPVAEAAEALRSTDVSVLPVLEDGGLVGVVTASDVVAMVAETDGRPPVRAIMSTPVTTVSPAATLTDAARRMRTAGVKHLPVVSDGVYRGVVSAATLAPYLSRHNLAVEWEREPMRIESTEGMEVTVGD